MFRNELTTGDGRIHSIEYNHLTLEEYRYGLAAMRQFIVDSSDKLPAIKFEYSITRPRGRWVAKPSRIYWFSASTSLWATTLATGEKLRFGNAHRIIVCAPNNSGIGIESSMLREMMIKHMDGAFGL